MFSINNAELLSLTHSCEFWGLSQNFRNLHDYSVKARISGSLSGETIAPVWSGMDILRSLATGVETGLIINGVSFPEVKITSISFDEGPDVRDKVYNLGFRIFQEGPMSGVGPLPELRYVNNFTSTIELTQDSMNVYGVRRNTSLSYDNVYTGGFTGALAAVFAYQDPFVNLSQSFPIPNFLSTTGVVKYSSMTRDAINGTFELDEEFKIASGLPYYFDYSHNLELGDDGKTTVSEQGRIESLKYFQTGDRMGGAIAGYGEIQAGIFSRVNDFYTRWNGTGCPLVNYPVTKSKTVNNSRGEISYSQVFTNDPAQQNGITHSYEHSIELGENGYLSLRENGEITSLDFRRPDNFNAALLYWSGVTGAVAARTQALYNTERHFFDECTSGNSLRLITSEQNYMEREARIRYDHGYTDDSTFITGGDFQRIIVRTQDNQPVHKFNMFAVLNDSEIMQSAKTSTEGSYSVTVDIIGRTSLPPETYLAEAVSRATPPDVTQFFKADERYSLSPVRNSFQYSVDFWYSKYRDLDVSIAV